MLVSKAFDGALEAAVADVIPNMKGGRTSASFARANLALRVIMQAAVAGFAEIVVVPAAHSSKRCQPLLELEWQKESRIQVYGMESSWTKPDCFVAFAAYRRCVAFVALDTIVSPWHSNAELPRHPRPAGAAYTTLLTSPSAGAGIGREGMDVARNDHVLDRVKADNFCERRGIFKETRSAWL